MVTRLMACWHRLLQMRIDYLGCVFHILANNVVTKRPSAVRPLFDVMKNERKTYDEQGYSYRALNSFG